MDLGLSVLAQVAGIMWTGLVLDSGQWTLHEHAFAVACVAMTYWVVWSIYFFKFANEHRQRRMYFPNLASYDALNAETTSSSMSLASHLEEHEEEEEEETIRLDDETEVVS